MMLKKIPVDPFLTARVNGDIQTLCSARGRGQWGYTALLPSALGKGQRGYTAKLRSALDKGQWGFFLTSLTVQTVGTFESCIPKKKLTTKSAIYLKHQQN